MRRTLKNHQEVAHFWANEVQKEGTSGNMFFEDKTIFSFGRHFAIAKNYDKNLVLFTTRSYSNSTTTHTTYTRQAIPHNKSIIYCHNPETPQDMNNLKYAISGIEGNLKKAIKARERKQWYLSEAQNIYNQLVLLKSTFKIKGWKIPTYDFSVPEKVMEVIEKKERKAEKARGEATQAGQA